MTGIKVTCVKMKPGGTEHEHVTHIGGPAGGGWCWKVAQIIPTIERGTNTFYLLADGKRLELGVEQGPKRKYLRARLEGAWSDALLTLPACD